jgi:hypothetical protein
MAKRSEKTDRIYYRMENPVDHTIDLGFVNYVQHPENKNYIVFRFADGQRAETFEFLLVEQKLWFEKGEEVKRNKPYFMYAVHKSDFKKVEQINYDTEAKHKKPIIPFKALRWSLLMFSFFVLVLATVGYCKAQNKLVESKVITGK